MHVFIVKGNLNQNKEQGGTREDTRSKGTGKNKGGYKK